MGEAAEKGGESQGEMRIVSPRDLPDLLKKLATEHADDVLWITAIRDDTGVNFGVRARVMRRKGPA